MFSDPSYSESSLVPFDQPPTHKRIDMYDYPSDSDLGYDTNDEDEIDSEAMDSDDDSSNADESGENDTEKNDSTRDLLDPEDLRVAIAEEYSPVKLARPIGLRSHVAREWH